VLVRKKQKWKWEKEQEEAFGKLKAVFTMEPVLVIPDIDREMRIEADTSDYATGGVLLAKCEDGKWRPVAFISKSLNTIERNYEIHDKEMLAVIRCLEAWRHYLEGAKLEFEIWTDHKNLQYQPKVKSKTSTMGFIPLTIQFYLKTRSREKHGEGRWVK